MSRIRVHIQVFGYVANELHNLSGTTSLNFVLSLGIVLDPFVLQGLFFRINLTFSGNAPCKVQACDLPFGESHVCLKFVVCEVKKNHRLLRIKFADVISGDKVENKISIRHL